MVFFFFLIFRNHRDVTSGTLLQNLRYFKIFKKFLLIFFSTVIFILLYTNTTKSWVINKQKPLLDHQKKNDKKYKIDQDKIKQLQEKTNFDKVEATKLYEVFYELSQGGKIPLNREQFKQGLTKLESCGLKNLDNTPFSDRLFELLDVNKDNTVDLQEFVGGLSILCKGSVEEKLELSFKAYDLDGNGYITKNELSQMFQQAWISGFKALSIQTNEDVNRDDLNNFSEEMAQIFAEGAFSSLDINGDGKLSLSEFKQFALSHPKITATLNGSKKDVPITF
ncbi:calcium-binding protein [Tieghemostelium lacteum]|uniref:Calcium-binding protein n=1 Tax=Tieghemostelium lacteum TaxID=361077 RepID=A0A151Z733_TIELA|nr:calcium-binding protein [Tieghemostelium lacteum]|eukprot:KYQ89745.1 calcium-binding protein [Tieghemostelium lacteum]